MKRLIPVVLALVFAPVAAGAATRMVIDTVVETSRTATEPAASAEPATFAEPAERTLVWAEVTQMRVDLAGGQRSIVYSADRGIVWALDHEKRTFIELDRSTAVGAAARVRGVQQELRARSAGLPESARAAADRLIDSAFGAPPGTSTLELRLSDKASEVRGIACQEADLFEAGERTARFCEASLTDANVPEEALTPLRSLAGLVREVSPLLPARVRDGGLAALDLFDRIEGLPLRVWTYREGQVHRVATVTEVEQANPPEGAFVLPDDYRPEINIKVRERLGGP